MARDYEVVISPRLVEQLHELGLFDQGRDAIRDAMSNPQQAGKQLTGSFFPYRRLKLSRYRIIYRVYPNDDPPKAVFLYCAIRKQGSKEDVYRQLEKVLKRRELEQ